MGFLDRLFGRKKGPSPRVLFDSDIKKMDVRNGSFIWLIDKGNGKEFCGDFSIKKVYIELPDGELAKRIHVKTLDGLVKIPLRDILENLGDRHGYYKFVHFKTPVRVKVFGVPNGDVELTFSRSKVAKSADKGPADGKDAEE